MKPPIQPDAVPPVVPSATRKRWLFWALGSVLALFIVIGATALFTIWWIQRPIQPVVLSAAEESAVKEKIALFAGATGPVAARQVGASTESQAEPEAPAASADQPTDAHYEAGSKVLKLTERELNGLLNANTDLGKTVRLELGTDAINAYLAVLIPEDFPVGGGKMFRARGRFLVSLGNDGGPFAILDDVTVFGLSLPKAWLGGVKGENLLSNVVGSRDGAPILHGVKSLQIKPGAVVIQLAE
jgi:hypothetical protein